MDQNGMLDLFEGVNVTRPSEQVVMQIRRLISRGLLKPGDMLPPERHLCEKLGISRGHVREGLKTLELYGIVKSIQGKGTVVTDLGIQSMSGLLCNLLNLAGDDILALADARILIESHTAKLAARNATPDDIRAISAILDEMRTIKTDTRRWLEADLSLHIAIAEASHNPVLAELVKFMTPNLVGYYRKFLANSLSITIKMHEKIVEEILAGRAAKAGKLMREHLMNSRHEFADLLGGSSRTRRLRRERKTG